MNQSPSTAPLLLQDQAVKPGGHMFWTPSLAPGVRVSDSNSAVVQQLTLSVFYGGLVLLYFGLCRSGEGCCRGTVPMVHQVAGDHAEDKTCPSYVH